IVTVLEHGVSGVLVSQIDTDGSLRLRDLGFGLLGLLLAILLHGWSDLLGTLSAVCAVPLARVPRPAVSSHLLPCRRGSARRSSAVTSASNTPGRSPAAGGPVVDCHHHFRRTPEANLAHLNGSGMSNVLVLARDN